MREESEESFDNPLEELSHRFNRGMSKLVSMAQDDDDRREEGHNEGTPETHRIQLVRRYECRESIPFRRNLLKENSVLPSGLLVTIRSTPSPTPTPRLSPTQSTSSTLRTRYIYKP